MTTAARLRDLDSCEQLGDDRRVLRSWRQRRMFERLVAQHAARVAPLIAKEDQRMRSAAGRIEARLARLPGAATRCPSCGRQLQMRRIPYRPYRARKDRWRMAYVCEGCSRQFPVSEIRDQTARAEQQA